jgi:DNA-3-methyladenine glycosylase I
MAKHGLTQGDDGRWRCGWAYSAIEYIDYHDTQWGYPVDSYFVLFEKICLEGFQAGLSWLTILRKRENFRRAFAKFDFEKVARFNTRSVERLLRDTGIVRHRGKIESTINNAKRARDLVDECGSLAAYFWRFEPPQRHEPFSKDKSTVLTTSTESKALSKDLKGRGWSFIGPTTAYAFMQAMGLVNDHVAGCAVRAQARDARKRFMRPT